MLTSFVPGRDTNPGRKMNQTDPAVRGILVLPSWSPGPERVHPALGEELFVGVRNRERVGGS